ncbi:proteasome component pup2 [Coemansia sp. RSA 552]|nr:proteasome component pup2 [Coemansia sp. RSA 552]
MAHQSGIDVSEALAAAFHGALGDSTVRVLQVTIVDEKLEAAGTLPVQGTLDEDLGQVPGLLGDSEPCYLLVRLDTPEPGSAKWLLATYVPDKARVRDKMLYAATKATLSKSLGESYFVDDMFGTAQEDFTAAGYAAHRRHAESQAPLTERELELERIREMESAAADMPTMDSRRSHVAGPTYPLHQDAEEALCQFAQGQVNFVLLSIEDEVVRAVRSESLQAHDELVAAIPAEEPSYALYWFNSTASVFIYSCPATSGIRQRMVYSTFRHGFIVTAKTFGINTDVRLEFDSPADITTEALAEAIDARQATMFLTRSEYDRGVNTFSPEGRLFQVEYAIEAIKLGTTAIGIRTSEGVILAVEKRITSPLLVADSIEKILEIDTHVACAMSGLTADSRTMIEHARVEALSHTFSYEEPIPVESVTQAVCDLALRFGEGADGQESTMSRPFGVALLIAGVDERGPQLYHTDPSGTFLRYEAKAIGAGSEGAQSGLQEQYHRDISLADAETLALKVLKQVMEEKLSNTNVQLAKVTKESGYQIYSKDELQAVITRM